MTETIKNNINKSQEFLKIKDFDSAENCLMKNLEISNDNFETFFLLGVINGIKKKFDNAEVFLKKAIKLNSKHVNLNLNLAIILKKLNKIDESIEFFNNVIELDQNNVEGLCGLAQICEDKNKLDDTEKYLKQALKINPKHQIANHAYGKILLKLNKHKEGLKLIEKASGIIRLTKDKHEIL
jgi:tetratricopeptide (TPR) repeat protein